MTIEDVINRQIWFSTGKVFYRILRQEAGVIEFYRYDELGDGSTFGHVVDDSVYVASFKKYFSENEKPVIAKPNYRYVIATVFTNLLADLD
jgi:hypothetical protein